MLRLVQNYSNNRKSFVTIAKTIAFLLNILDTSVFHEYIKRRLNTFLLEHGTDMWLSKCLWPFSFHITNGDCFIAEGLLVSPEVVDFGILVIAFGNINKCSMYETTNLSIKDI